MACPLSQVAVLWPFLGRKDKLLRLKLLLREKNQHGSGGNPSKVVFFSMYFEVAHFHDKDILCENRDAFTADDELYCNTWKLCVWHGIVSRLWQQIPGAYLIWMIRHTAEVYLFTHKELSLVKGGTEKGQKCICFHL